LFTSNQSLHCSPIDPDFRLDNLSVSLNLHSVYYIFDFLWLLKGHLHKVGRLAINLTAHYVSDRSANFTEMDKLQLV